MKVFGSIYVQFVKCILHDRVCIIFPSAVCISFLNKFVKRMAERGAKMTDPDRIEVELMKACADSQGKDHRFVSIFLTWIISVSVYATCVSLVHEV